MITLIPKNLCAIILSTIYLSPKNLGRKFELIWATENLGTNSSKMSDFPLNHQLYICLRSLSFLNISVIFTLNCMHVGGSLSCQTLRIFTVTPVADLQKVARDGKVSFGIATLHSICSREN